MQNRHVGLHCVHLLIHLLLPGMVLAQGALAPPGPPAATMKTLQEVEPRIDIETVNGTDIFAEICCTIKDCTVANNKGDGIYVLSQCLVKDNNSCGNGDGSGNGSGIHAVLDSNSIVENHVSDNDTGIIHLDPGANICLVPVSCTPGP